MSCLKMMNDMNFKEMLQKDIKTFINPNEFGSLADIEGELVTIIRDDEKMVERQLAKEVEGLHKEELLFYVEKSSLSFYPRPDNVVKFDELRWRITQTQEDDGIFTITAELMSG